MAAESDRMLATLESAVLGRIAAHRASRKTLVSLSLASLLAVTALAGGVLTGMAESRHGSWSQGSEAALLAEDVDLAPSFLLASN